MDLDTSSNISMAKSKNNKEKKHYKKRDPLYYYYNIGGHNYKYTCENKDYKNCLRFKCSDTKCPAKGIYYEYLETFIPKEGDQYKHIEYESRSYIIPECRLWPGRPRAQKVSCLPNRPESFRTTG